MRSLAFKKFKVWFLMFHSTWVALLLLGLLWLGMGSEAGLHAQDLQCQDGTKFIVIKPSELNLKEGTSGSYEVRLCQQPLPEASVTVKVAAKIGGELNFEPSILVFTQADFTVPKTIDVRAFDDKIFQNDRQVMLENKVEATNPEQVAQILVKIFDNEGDCDETITALILAESSTLKIEEGKSDSYKLRLCKPPTASVKITVAAEIPNVVTVDPPTLDFTPENYATPQPVRVTASKDDDAQDDRVINLLHKVIDTSDLSYQNESGGLVKVTVTNNDLPGTTCNNTTPISVTPTVLQIVEGTTQTYQIDWCKKLTQNVTITISATKPITVAPSKITFLPENNKLLSHTVVVTATDDNLYTAVDRLVRLTHTVTSTDSDLPTLEKSPVVAVTIKEDEKGILLPLIMTNPTPKPISPITWTHIITGGPSVDVVLVHKGTLFAGHRRSGGVGGGLYKGNTCRGALTRVTSEFSTRDIVFNPTSDKHGVVGTFNERAYYSDDTGAKWSQTQTSSMNPYVYDVVYSKAPNTVYAGADDGLYVSNDNGVKWSFVSANSPKFAYALYFESAANRLWIGSYQSGIWQVTLDKPTVFTKINDGLPSNNVKALEIWEIVVDGTDFYIATSNGVYKRAGSGAWQAYGLQGVQVFSLEVVKDQTSSWLYAGLNAGGVHRTALTSNPAWASISSSGLTSKTVRDLVNDTTIVNNTTPLCGGLLAATDDGVWLYK